MIWYLSCPMAISQQCLTPWRLFPHTRWLYAIKSKAAISLTFDLHCKEIAGLLFIPYCYPFKDICHHDPPTLNWLETWIVLSIVHNIKLCHHLGASYYSSVWGEGGRGGVHGEGVNVQSICHSKPHKEMELSKERWRPVHSSLFHERYIFKARRYRYLIYYSFLPFNKCLMTSQRIYIY